LTIKGSIAAKGTATVGDGIELGIVSVDDITASAVIEGTFPIYGNALILAGIAVGGLDVDAQATPATTTNMLSGSVEQAIAAWRFTASSTESVSVSSIKVTHVGTATGDDISNLKLKISGVQIGETIESLNANNQVVFDLSDSPIEILASASKTVYAYCDIGVGIWTERTIRFEITQYTDVVAYGANSGGAMIITYGSADQCGVTAFTTFSKQTGNKMTIGQVLWLSL